MPHPDAEKKDVTTEEPTRLRTLGALALSGAGVTRPKPLLLVAYLAHEGPTERARLAQVFFPDAEDRRDALSTTVGRLKGLVRTAESGDRRLSTHVTTDALEFERFALQVDPQTALSRYVGAFLPDLGLPIGLELEEWVLATRERLASIARDLHIAVARRHLRGRDRVGLWRHLQAAVSLTQAHALDAGGTVDLLRRAANRGLAVSDGWRRAMEGGPVAWPKSSRKVMPPTAASRREARDRRQRSLRRRPAQGLGDHLP